MRKAFVLLISITMITITAVAVGCGGGAEDQQVNFKDILLEGKNWTYEGEHGDLIVFAENDTFRSVIDDKVEDGTYKVFEADEGNWVELTFINEEGEEDRVQEWSMTSGIGEGDVITDLQGQQFALRGTREDLR